MSPFQLAKYFDCDQEVISQAAKMMGLKITPNNVKMSSFHTPYPPQVGKSAKLFNWETYYLEAVENDGQEKIHSTDS